MASTSPSPSFWNTVRIHPTRPGSGPLPSGGAGIAIPRRRGDKISSRPPAAAGPGKFLDIGCAIGGTHRNYKLFIPSTYRGKPMPLIVMLHGCKQSPDDFALGTQMNLQAQLNGCLVAYPAQSVTSNCNNCWNWFSRTEQIREGREPSIIAGIARHVGESYAIDRKRVFVAGLSAGAAMALIVGATHPDVFHAVAVHSGLPLGAAHDAMSAFSAMQGVPRRPAGVADVAVPIFVIHGDGDPLVAASNSQLIVERAVNAFDPLQPLARKRLIKERHGGFDCDVTRYLDGSGRAMVEDWIVTGGGHTWFGGDAAGSFTDVNGPNASQEMVRFFLSQEWSNLPAASARRPMLAKAGH